MKKIFVKSNGVKLHTARIVDFLLDVRQNLKAGVRKSVAIEIASERIDTFPIVGRQIWENRYKWLKVRA